VMLRGTLAVTLLGTLAVTASAAAAATGIEPPVSCRPGGAQQATDTTALQRRTGRLDGGAGTTTCAA
jgi:hypothetical protein